MSTVCNLSVVNNWDTGSQSSTGRLEVFRTPTETLGVSVPLQHIWQTAPNNGWSAWQSLGGQLSAVLGDIYSSTVAVGENHDGRLEAFAADSHGTLFHIWQTSPGGGWSSWTTLGSGHQVVQVAVAQSFRLPHRVSGAGAGQNQDGRLEVFAVDNSGTPIHIWQTSPGGSWSSWNNLSDGYGGQAMTVGQNGDGRLEVFGVDGHGTVFHAWQTVPNGTWSNWGTLGGGYTIVQIALGQNADGRLELFGIDSHGSLFHIWQTSAGGGWSGGWLGLGGGYQIKWIAVAQNQDGRLETFGVDNHGSLLHIWQISPGGTWSGGWITLGSGHQATRITVGQDSDGRLELFDIDSHGTAFHLWQTVPNGSWSDWSTL